MFTSADFKMLETEADFIFNTLPFESRFSFIWKKATVKPLAVTYTTVWENVAGIIVPPISSNMTPSPIGEFVKQDHLELAIQKRFGETIYLDGLTYIGGIQENDVIEDQDGVTYRIRNKQRRGYGAYYVLQLELFKTYDTTWIKGQKVE